VLWPYLTAYQIFASCFSVKLGEHMAPGSDDSALQEKVQFHQILASLEESDGDEDAGLYASVAALRHPAKTTVSKKEEATLSTRLVRKNVAKNDNSENPRSLRRLVSDLGPSVDGQAQFNAKLHGIPTSSAPGGVRTSKMAVRHTPSGNLPPPSSMPQATGKRKRESVVTPIPKEQQTFDGLHFYFFPNNEKHPARFMRISKAIAFGASWHREWTSFVTHVIVDQTMDYAMLLKFLKKDDLPAGVICVNGIWPSECIAYRALLDHTRPQFRVPGAPTVAAIEQVPAAEVPASSAGSETSLKLKPPGRDVTVSKPETQSTDEGSAVPDRVTPDIAPFGAGVSSIVTPDPGVTDELDFAISQARDLQLMPLDDDDSRPSSSEGLSAKITSTPTDGQPGSKRLTFQEKFQCMQKHTGEISNNANSATIVLLQQMADYYGQMGDEWRMRAYRKAIATLRNHPIKVCTKDEALALPDVGERLATKIEEIVFTSRLRRLDNALAEPQDQILQTFMKIYGAGFAYASQWVRQGYTTIDELLQKADLTENQKIGIAHFEDFQERITRAEVAEHGELVRRTLHKLDPTFEVTIGGSYRRCAEDSGDIDLIITRPDAGIDHVREVVVNQLVPQLFSTGFLKVALAATSGDGSKWHGACCLPGYTRWRRIDFLLIPWVEMGAALIYFTGNDIFNRSMRLLASTKGYRLNQRGLYKDFIRGRGREKITEGALVESKSERKIFDILGVPWRPPEHRIP
jgi:DNA polymerase IV